MALQSVLHHTTFTEYSPQDLIREARRAVKHATCWPCGAKVVHGRYTGWSLHLGQSTDPTLLAHFTCPSGHTTSTSVAI